METAVLTAAGWASGLNAYLTVFVLGIAARTGWSGAAPDALGETWILLASFFMFVVEFFVDKIPFVDSAWDAVHTVVRPLVAAWIGTEAVGIDQPWASVLAAGLALTGHSAKATTRLAINASPEPFSNSVASLSEDGAVLALMLLAVTRPEIAAVVAIVFAIVCVLITIVMFKLARRGWRALRRVWAERSD